MNDRLTTRNEYGDAILCDRLQGIGICLNEDVERVALYEDEREKPQWISVGKGLPRACTTVLVCRRKPGGERIVEQGTLQAGGWWRVYGTRVKTVTHWMPLPEPPEVSNND